MNLADSERIAGWYEGKGWRKAKKIQEADEIIIVTNPEMPSLTDALKTIKIAEQHKTPVLGVIVTRVRKDDIEMNPETVKEMLEVPILGMVPDDIAVSKSLNQKDAVVHTHPKSKAARAYKEIVANLLNIHYDSTKDAEKFLERLLKKFGFGKK